MDKKINSQSKTNTDKWNPEFTPSLTPPEMLAKGVFEGKYVNGIKEVPQSWKVKGKVLTKTDEPNPEVNYYGVKARMPLSHWKEKDWIRTDKEGWFGWYIRYFLGRRLGAEDDWQVGRWKSFVARHNAQVQSKCKAGDKTCNTRQRQALLQFAWDSDTAFTDEQKKKNLARVSKLAKPVTSLATEGLAHDPAWLKWR